MLKSNTNIPDCQSIALKDLLSFTRDGEWGKGEHTENHAPALVIRGTDFEAVRHGNLSSLPIRYIRCDVLDRKRLQPSDVLLETAGGSKGRPTGRSLFLKESILERAGLPIVCASFSRFLRPDKSRIEPEYLFWWLQYLYKTGEMDRHQVQHTGVARFQYTRFAESIHPPLPVRDTQRRIAHILGTLDDKIELNRRMNQTLEAIARAIFKSWFIDFDPVIDNALASGKLIPEELRKRAEIRTGQNQPSPRPSPIGRGWQKAPSDGTYGVSSSLLGRGEGEGAVDYHRLFPDEFQDSLLGKIPKGWEVKPFSEIVEINPIRTLRKGTVSPYVDMASLPTAGSQLEAEPIDREYKSGSRFQNGDVLFARITPCLENGKTVLVDFLEDGVVAAGSTEFLVLGPDLAGSYFAYCASRWEALRDHAIAAMTGTSGRQRVQKSAFDHFEMAVPSRETLMIFEEMMRPLFVQQQSGSMESRSLAGIRDVLLPRLLSGERVGPGET